VLDTTGSVIYTGNHLLMRLRKLMKVVYLAASDAEQHLLIERYLGDPKPVLWRGAFVAKAGESPRETVARCYPNLIAARRQGYAALGDATLEVAELRALPQTAEAFFEQSECRVRWRRGECAMRYRSTGGKAALTSLRGAVLRGLAPDGGLYMPVE